MLRWQLVACRVGFPIAPKTFPEATRRCKGTPAWESTTQLLHSHGVDTKNFGKPFRRTLKYDASKTEAVVNILAHHRIEVGKVISRNPELLSLASEVLGARIEFMKALGIDAPKAVHCHPTVLNLLSQTIKTKMLFLASIGFDAKALIHRSSAVLTHSEPAILNCIAFLKDSGLDAMRIINADPNVFGYNIERKLRPTIAFILHDMGRPLDEISRCPRCFSASLVQRLKPRYRYTVLYGKRNDYSLNTFATKTDEYFVRMVGHKPLEHYIQWRASHSL